MASKLLKKTSSGTSPVSFYKKTSTGQTRCPVYIKTATGQQRLDQQLVTKTYVVSGYSDWTCCYIGSSSTDTVLSQKGTDPLPPRQGKYSSYYYFSPMSFKSLFAKVEGKNITNAKIRMKCDHSYNSTGLSTFISGTTITNTSEPSSISNSVFNNKRYSSDTHFDRGETLTITLNSTAISDIKNGNITGLRPIASAGFSLTDYGYFNEIGTTRPWVEITYTEQVWE